jgi:cysteine desulfurase
VTLIYWDYNATTPLWPEVAALLARRYAELTGNPSSVHGPGRAARARLTQARESVAKVFGCEPKEVVFTASGSEGAALALFGAFRSQGKKRIVTTPIEHPSVLGAVAQLEKEGAEVVRTLDPLGAIDSSTALVSAMWVNNETGALLPVAEIARAAANAGAVFHCDAVQAVARLPVSLREVPADLLSISAHKLGGPPGVGALIARKRLGLSPLVPGHQEDGRRGGTQAVVLAEALALALSLTTASVETEGQRLTALRDRFEGAVRERIADVHVNAGSVPRVGGVSNLRFTGADGEALLIALDLEGIHVSSGAACASGSLKPSHVLTALGLSSTDAQASLRFSMGRGTTDAEVDAVVAALERHVPKARAA